MTTSRTLADSLLTAQEDSQPAPTSINSLHYHLSSAMALPRAFRIRRQRKHVFIDLKRPTPFPKIAKAEQLTTEWLTLAWRWRGYLQPDGEVISITSHPIGEGLGAFGDLMQVACELRGALPHAPTRFIAKFAPQGQTPLPKFVVKAAFETESI